MLLQYQYHNGEFYLHGEILKNQSLIMCDSPVIHLKQRNAYQIKYKLDKILNSNGKVTIIATVTKHGIFTNDYPHYIYNEIRKGFVICERICKTLINNPFKVTDIETYY